MSLSPKHNSFRCSIPEEDTKPCFIECGIAGGYFYSVKLTDMLYSTIIPMGFFVSYITFRLSGDNY